LRARLVVPLLLAALLSFGLCEAHGQVDSTDVVHYDLAKESRFETGCFGPCACPVLISGPLEGVFDLRHIGFDGLYENYEVTSVRWTVSDKTTNISIQGSDTYRVGGEFAIQQHLKLDLRVGSGPPRQFDSGLVAGGGGFPRIVIDISLHQNKACRDTVMHIDASPDPVTSVGEVGPGSRARLDPVAPNPFSQRVLLRLALPSVARGSVLVYDIQGRAVRHLYRGVWLGAGAHPFTWDGRGDDGRATSSGVYFISAGVGSQRVSCRVVKAQ